MLTDKNKKTHPPVIDEALNFNLQKQKLQDESYLPGDGESDISNDDSNLGDIGELQNESLVEQDLHPADDDQSILRETDLEEIDVISEDENE